ncbi:hypothetical protein IMY05_C4419001100 [Salix suchowensis]|nr:hypothetical protein IMY05_C4419001100 [Salix suchowensis]
MDFDQPKFHRESVRIPSKTPGWDLDAWVYTPTLIATSTTVLSSTSESGGRTRRRASPVIVMYVVHTSSRKIGCPAFDATSSYEQGPRPRLYEIPRIVLLCRSLHDGWLRMCRVRLQEMGDSGQYRVQWRISDVMLQSVDGTPRHCTYFQDQMDDYASVVKYCRQHEEFGFDPQRLILWGYSFSADIVMTTLSLNPVYIPTAAEPTDVGAVIAPGSTDGFRRLPGVDSKTGPCLPRCQNYETSKRVLKAKVVEIPEVSLFAAFLQDDTDV